MFRVLQKKRKEMGFTTSRGIEFFPVMATIPPLNSAIEQQKSIGANDGCLPQPGIVIYLCITIKAKTEPT